MPAAVEWEANGVIHIYSGDTTDEDMLSSREDVYSHPDFAKIRYQIVDATRVEKLLITADCMRDIASSDEEIAKRHPGIKVAIVAPRDVLYGIARMYGTLSEDSPWEFNIFENLDDAHAWVNG